LEAQQRQDDCTVFKPCARCRAQYVTSLHAANAGAKAARGAPGRVAELADKLLARPRRQLRDVHVLNAHAAYDGLDVLHRAELVPARRRSGRLQAHRRTPAACGWSELDGSLVGRQQLSSASPNM